MQCGRRADLLLVDEVFRARQGSSSAAGVRAQPVGQFVFAQFARGERLDQFDRLAFGEFQHLSIDAQELAREYPGRALVAVHERMIARDSKGMGGSKRAQVVGAMAPLVDRSPKRRIQRSRVADSDRPAMFGQLAIVDREDNVVANPARFGSP